MHLPSSIAVAFVLISTALHCQQADIGSEMPQIVAGVEEKAAKQTKEIHEQTGEYSKIMKEIEEQMQKRRKEYVTIYACTLTIALFISFCTMHLVAAWMIQ